MAKLITGRAGRQQKREERLEKYTAALLPLLLKQLKIDPATRVLHLGSPGAAAIVEAIAPHLTSGEMLVVVYSYDEMEDTRAALAGLGNVEVVNELDDIDPDEPPFNLVTCIAPYQHGRDYVDELLAASLELLAPSGVLVLGGDRQQGLERNLETLAANGSGLTRLAQNGQYQVVSATKPVRGGLRRRSDVE
jgi:16S rRNA G1207 methylase RsmC